MIATMKQGQNSTFTTALALLAALWLTLAAPLGQAALSGMGDDSPASADCPHHSEISSAVTDGSPHCESQESCQCAASCQAPVTLNPVAADSRERGGVTTQRLAPHQLAGLHSPPFRPPTA